MRRPTVLHCARDWVRPSEGFVADVVRSTTATRAVLAYRRRHSPSPADEVAVRGYDVTRLSGRVPLGSDVRRRVATLTAVAAAERAAVLHAHFGYWAPEVARAAARLRRPWVVSLHGHDALVQADEELRRAVRTAALVVVPSQFLADRVAAWVPDECLRVIPSGVDIGRLPFRARRPTPGGVVVTFAGRFVAKKGVLDAARAMADVRARHPHLVARFVGAGPVEGELRGLLADLRLDAEVLDGAEPGAVRRALDATDLLLTPSRTGDDGDAETLGLVNVEAMACGVPVVTTRHGGVPEAVPPEAGVLVPEGDLPALTAALEDLVVHPERWAQLGAAGRRRATLHFELGARVADLEEQYLALARTGRPGPKPRRPRDDWPAVSVVVPTRDRRDLLGRCLDALAAQTYPADRVQVVVADDGSTDGTAASVAGRAEVVRLDEPTSSGQARNRALEKVTGEVVAFTDDDCRPTPTWLEALVAGMPAGVGIVQGRTTADPDQWLRPLSRTQWTPAEYGLYETANVAYSAGALQRASTPEGPFDPVLAARAAALLGRRFGYPFGEDTDLAWRAKRAGVTSRFAVHAVVHHEVYDPDPRYLLRRAVVAAAFPLLVRQVPELRAAFLWRRYLLSSRHAALLAALGGLAATAAARRAAPAALATPYLWRVVRPTRAGRRERLRAAPVVVLRDLVELGACAYGSARTGSLVL